MRKTIAVDFDGCLCESKWPDIGAPRQRVINELIREQAEGARLILWTCREGEQLDAAVMWCLNRGLRFDTVNDNLPENKERFGTNCRKVLADEYWDDKNVLISDTEPRLRMIQVSPLADRTVELWLKQPLKEGWRQKWKRRLFRLFEYMRLPEP